MRTQTPIRILLLLVLLLAGCAKKKPVTASTPPPPPLATSQQAKPQQPLVAGDLLIKNCAVTNREADTVTCKCRRARTNIDAKGRGYMVVECR